MESIGVYVCWHKFSLGFDFHYYGEVAGLQDIRHTGIERTIRISREKPYFHITMGENHREKNGAQRSTWKSLWQLNPLHTSPVTHAE